MIEKCSDQHDMHRCCVTDLGLGLGLGSVSSKVRVSPSQLGLTVRVNSLGLGLGLGFADDLKAHPVGRTLEGCTHAAELKQGEVSI